MLRKLRQRAGEERGFTLIELLVVVLIIGILAAIALPTFLSQQSKGQDASAKSDARNLVSQVESCNTDNQDYTKCEDSTAMPNTGLNMAAYAAAVGAETAGQVGVEAASASGYTIAATSKSGTTYYIQKAAATGLTTRSCDKPSTGGCKSDSSW